MARPLPFKVSYFRKGRATPYLVRYYATAERANREGEKAVRIGHRFTLEEVAS